MIESAFFTALFGALVVVFFSLFMVVAALVLSLVGLVAAFIAHVHENRKARKLATGR